MYLSSLIILKNIINCYEKNNKKTKKIKKIKR